MSYSITAESLTDLIAQGKSALEIAARFGCSETTVYNHLRRHRLTMPSRDLQAGTRFGNLTVVSKTGSNGTETFYECACDCGNTIVVKRGNLTAKGKSSTRSCGCSRRGTNSKNFKGEGELPGRYWTQLQAGAQGRSIEFCVSIQEAWRLFLLQGRRCALSGLPIAFGPRGTQTASLDRKDSSLGYTPTNVQWVHKDVNTMKWDLTQARFIELCCAVAVTHG